MCGEGKTYLVIVQCCEEQHLKIARRYCTMLIERHVACLPDNTLGDFYRRTRVYVDYMEEGLDGQRKVS